MQSMQNYRKMIGITLIVTNTILCIEKHDSKIADYDNIPIISL